jgi:hypothetical protein
LGIVGVRKQFRFPILLHYHFRSRTAAATAASRRRLIPRSASRGTPIRIESVISGARLINVSRSGTVTATQLTAPAHLGFCSSPSRHLLYAVHALSSRSSSLQLLLVGVASALKESRSTTILFSTC